MDTDQHAARRRYISHRGPRKPSLKPFFWQGPPNHTNSNAIANFSRPIPTVHASTHPAGWLSVQRQSYARQSCKYVNFTSNGPSKSIRWWFKSSATILASTASGNAPRTHAWCSMTEAAVPLLDSPTLALSGRVLVEVVVRNRFAIFKCELDLAATGSCHEAQCRRELLARLAGEAVQQLRMACRAQHLHVGLERLAAGDFLPDREPAARAAPGLGQLLQPGLPAAASAARTTRSGRSRTRTGTTCRSSSGCVSASH